MIIRRINVLSAAKIAAIIAFAIGILAGLMFFAMSSMMPAPPEGMPNEAGMSMMKGMGALSIIVFPVMYGIFGFIGGALQAFIYNLAAKFVGGIQFETD